MTAIANSPIRRAANPRAHYRQLREDGHDHAEAIRKVSHAYSRPTTEIARLVRPVREEIEHPTPEAPEPEPVDQAEPDRFDAVETEIRGKIAELERSRASLALDALSDERKARELGDVEARLAGARAELERVGLARVEAERRELAEREQDEAKATAAARQQASELQLEREAAARAVDEAGASFAAALARHQGIAGQQAQMLGIDHARSVAPQWLLERVLSFAIANGGAPLPADLGFEALTKAAPLAALDPHLIDPPAPKAKPNDDTKE